MKLIRILVVLAWLPMAMANAGEIYRQVGPDGRVSFTDSPPDEDAELLELGPVNTVPGMRPTTPEATAVPAVTYKSLVVVGISPGQLLANPAEGLALHVQIDPPLDPAHAVFIQHNGREIGLGKETVYSLGMPERGLHTVSAEIRDAEGRSLIGSSPLSFQVTRPIAR